MAVNYDPDLVPLPHESGVLLIHLLSRCNLHCQHCYLDASPWCQTYLPMELVTQSIDEAEQLGVGTIYLSGGEPFLYPTLPELLAYISQKQVFNLRISTNGTLIEAADAALLKETGTNVQISIDGPEAYHDQFRGVKGAFQRTVRGIQNLVALEVPVTIVTTICQDNIGCLSWLAEWSAIMGVGRISIQPLLQLGRGSNIREKRLSDGQLQSLFLELSDLGHAYRSRQLEFSLAYRTRQFLMAHPCAAYVCQAAHCHRNVAKEIKKIVIREDGTVLPEIPTLNPIFALGNLREGSLSELVADYYANGYAQFQDLCRSTYEDVVPTYASPIVPWDEIISEHSWAVEYNAAIPG